MRHVNITVSGRVQGVGFRFESLRKANAFNVRGFAKNMANGDVYIEAEGEEKNIKAFIQFCKEGPFLANVEHLDVTDGDVKNYSAFDIKF